MKRKRKNFGPPVPSRSFITVDQEIRQLKALIGLAKKATPPPTLYRYRSPSEWTIKEIRNCEVHAAGPGDMNDPFEYRAPLDLEPAELLKTMIEHYVSVQGCEESVACAEAEKALGQVSENLKIGIRDALLDSGVVCFSETPHSIRMWSYYGDSHRGICLGYRTDLGPLCLAMKVRYEDIDQPLNLIGALEKDATILADHVSLRKSSEWAFEREYRIPIGPIKGRTRLLPLHPESLIEIRFGVRIDSVFREEVIEVARKLANRPKLIQMGCDFDKFILTENTLDY